MKCPALIRFGMRGSKYPKWKIVQIAYQKWFDNGHKKYYGHTRDEFEVCGGRVTVKIENKIDPGYGYGDLCDCSPSLHIDYKCERCGNIYFDNLPSDEDELCKVLQAWLDRKRGVLTKSGR
jgi:hypothetical protein